MACSAGPDIIESGLVLALDAADYNSFKGESVTNLYYASSGASANTSIFHMPMGGTATGSYTTSHSYGSWSGNTIFKVTVSSGTLVGYESFRHCVPASFDSTYGTTRRVSAKVKMLKGSITSLGYHTGGGTGGHSSSHYTPISESSVPTDVLSKDGWYQFDLDVSGSYPFGHCVGIGIVGSDIEFLVTEMMLYPSSTFVRFTPTTRGSTVATGGGWADLIGNGNHGELVNGVKESSDKLGALVFDGFDEYISVSNSSLLNLGTQFTISSLIKINNISTFVPIFTCPNVNTGVYTEGYLFYYNNTSEYGMSANTLRLQFGQNAWRWNVYASNGIAITDNNWHFVSVTASGLNTSSPTILFYIDNISTLSTYWNASSTGPIRYSSNINSSRVASVYYPDNPSYDGPYYGNLNVAQLSIYNRALTSQEIQQNFNMMRGRFGI